VKETPI